jgi:hypothetical protein
MFSKSPDGRVMSFGLKLTLWYAFVFVLAATAWSFVIFHLIDDSIGKEWTVTRSRIVTTWAQDTAGARGEVAIAQQRAVIEGRVPGELNTLSHLRRAFYKIALPIIALGLVGGWVVTSRGLRPLRAISRTVRHILSTGKTSARVPVYARGGELNELVETGALQT